MYKHKHVILRGVLHEHEKAEKGKVKWMTATLLRLDVTIAVDMTVVAVGVTVGVAVHVAVDMGHRGGLVAEVLLAVGIVGHHPGAALFSDLHLGLVALVVLCPDGGEEVDGEAEDVKGVDEGDDPLENGSDVAVLCLLRDTEDDAQADFNDDESKLDPERVGEDRVLAVVDTQALVLPADEDGTDNVANDEHSQEDLVKTVVVDVVEDGQENQTSCTGDGGDDAAPRVDLLPNRRVAVKLAGVTQVALEDESQVKRDDGHGAHCDEHGLKRLGADIYMC
jgi:hypothetical protein